jgi:general secretion pathway protein N
MKQVLRYLAIGLPLYLLFLVALFPAAQAWRFAAEPLASTVPELKLAGLDGTVWSGRAGMVVYRKALLGEMNWQLSPMALLFGQGELQAMLQSDNGYLLSRVSTPLGGGSVALADIEGQLPLSELMRFAPYLPVALDGRVSLNLPVLELSADGRLHRADGTLTWHQAAMSAPQALSFGDLQLVLRTEAEGQVVGVISDRGGPLSITGTVQFSPNGVYVLNASIAAAEGAPAELRGSLGMLGKPDAQGRHRLNYTGKL